MKLLNLQAQLKARGSQSSWRRVYQRWKWRTHRN